MGITIDADFAAKRNRALRRYRPVSRCGLYADMFDSPSVDDIARYVLNIAFIQTPFVGYAKLIETASAHDPSDSSRGRMCRDVSRR
jgi:hypothetical protein